MKLDEFATRLRQSRAIVFFTGAGISTESGVPDFRSPGGIWTKYQPVLFQDFLASESARVQHWQLKKATYELFKTVKPNLAHYAICEFEQRGQLLGLITQNIDGLHKLAGTSEAKLVELHGTDRHVTCLQCGKHYQPAHVYEAWHEKLPAPTCEDCYFRRHGLCAMAPERPCPTFRAAARTLRPPRQPRLVPLAVGTTAVA